MWNTNATVGGAAAQYSESNQHAVIHIYQQQGGKDVPALLWQTTNTSGSLQQVIHATCDLLNMGRCLIFVSDEYIFVSHTSKPDWSSTK